MTDLSSTISLTSHSSQSAAIAIGNKTFKGDDFPMFETCVTQYFQTHNIYHVLQTAPSGPSSRVSMGGTVREIEEDGTVVKEIAVEEDGVETELIDYYGEEEEKDDARAARQAQNNRIEASNAIIIKNNLIRERKRAGIARMSKITNTRFAAYTYIFTALTVDTAKMFLHIVPGNVFALWEAIKSKYKGVTLVSQAHIRSMIAATFLGMNEDIDIYVSKINGYQLQLIELKCGMIEEDLIYHLCKGLPESYQNLLEIIRQTSNSMGVTLTFNEYVKRLREHQVLQRNKLAHAEANAAYEKAYYSNSNISGNTQHTRNHTQQTQSHGNTQTQTNIPLKSADQSANFQQSQKRRMIVCWRCEKEHYARECKIEAKDVTCDVCKKIGHVTSQHDTYTHTIQRNKAINDARRMYKQPQGHLCSAVVVDDVVVSVTPSAVVRNVVVPVVVPGVVVSDTDGVLHSGDVALITNQVKHYVLDSGASQHFTNDINTMKNVNKINPIHLQTAGKECVSR